MTQNESYMKLSARWPAHVHLLVLSEAFVYLASSQVIVLLDKTTCVFERESSDEIQPETAPTYLLIHITYCDGKLMLTSDCLKGRSTQYFLLFTFPPSFTLLKKE